MQKTTIALIVLTGCLAAGCAAPAQVIETNPGIYSVNVGALGIEGGEAAARSKALASASSYCSARGQTLNVEDQTSRGPVDWGSSAGSSQVRFRCISR